MKLSQVQEDLLQQLGVHNGGLTSDEALALREEAGHFNTVNPPIQCPAWICCLLPCIKHIPSQKAYRQIKPDDAEVRRDGKWIRYDASSLVKGDIIRMEEGDGVPADCTVLHLEKGCGELLVDHRVVLSEEKPRSARILEDATTEPKQLFWGGRVVQGSCIAVVTTTGPFTLAARLIREGLFPPQTYVDVATTSEDEEAGISLIRRGEGA